MVLGLAACDQAVSAVVDAAPGAEAGVDVGVDLAGPDLPSSDSLVPDLVRDILHPDKPTSYPRGAWSVTCGSEKPDYANDVAVDPSRNIYVVGQAGAGPLVCPGKTLAGKGGADGFVLKLDPSGKVLWGLMLGSAGSDRIHEVAVDAKGRVYVAGTLGGAAALGKFQLPKPGTSQGFVARLNGTGVVEWAVALSVQGWSSARAIDADAAGDLCVAGQFIGKLAAGGSAPGYAIYVARMNAAGVWQGGGVVPAGTDGFTPWGVALDGKGGCVAGGSFRSEVKFGKTKLSTKVMDGFVAGMDKAGSFSWAHQFGGAAFDRVFALDRLVSGAVVMTGGFKGSITAGSTALTSQGDQDALVARFDPAGKWTWAVSAGGPAPDYLFPARGQGSDIWVAGARGGAMTLGSMSLPATYNRMGVAARMDAKGKFLWAASATGTDDNGFQRPVVDSKGDLVLAGALRKKASFLGVTSTAGKVANSTDEGDVWVVKVQTGP